MTLRITASAASQICLLADAFNNLTQIISDNENLRICNITIFKAWKGSLGGGLREGIFNQFSNHICKLSTSFIFKKTNNCGVLTSFSSAFTMLCLCFGKTISCCNYPSISCKGIQNLGLPSSPIISSYYKIRISNYSEIILMKRSTFIL